LKIERTFARLTYGLYDNLLMNFYFRVIGQYIRQAQNKIQASSLSKQEKSTNEKKNLSLLEKMIIQSVYPNDISILLMDMMILDVQAVISKDTAVLLSVPSNKEKALKEPECL